MQYAAHRVVVAPHQMQANQLVYINERGEWTCSNHILLHQELPQTCFHNGILFPIFPSLVSLPETLLLFEQLKTAGASIDDALTQLCYIPWEQAIITPDDSPCIVANLSAPNWQTQTLSALTRLHFLSDKR